MKTMVAQDGQDSVNRFVHTLQADCADGQLSQARHRWIHASHATSRRIAGYVNLSHVHQVTKLRLNRVVRRTVKRLVTFVCFFLQIRQMLTLTLKKKQ